MTAYSWRMPDKDKADKGKASRATTDTRKAEADTPNRGAADKGRSGKGTTDLGLAGKGKAGLGVADTSTRGPQIVEVGEPDLGDVVGKAVADKDKIDAIVSPRTDDPTARIVPGARVRNCAQCLADVFVAPSTFAFFKGKPMPPIWCVPCALLAAETHGKSSRTGRA